MFGLDHPVIGLAFAVIMLLPILLVTIAVVVIAVIGSISSSPSSRRHSLRVLSSLTNYGRMLRSRPRTRS